MKQTLQRFKINLTALFLHQKPHKKSNLTLHSPIRETCLNHFRYFLSYFKTQCPYLENDLSGSLKKESSFYNAGKLLQPRWASCWGSFRKGAAERRGGNAGHSGSCNSHRQEPAPGNQQEEGRGGGCSSRA